MKEDLSNHRKIYQKSEINFEELKDPYNLFEQWFNIAKDDRLIEEVNAMVLSTVANNEYPKGRVVLLKKITPNGFVFFSNYNSDKGISIGENSTVIINHVQIQNSNIGIAVKDKSIAYIDPTSISNVGLDNVPIDNGVYISNTRIGFAVYQKKPEFGPGEIHIGNKDEVYTNLILDNVEDHFIVEEKSFLELGASEITDFKNDVYKSLYPKN